MKPKTFFAIALFFPYLCWIVAKLLTTAKTLDSISYIYISTIWVWGIPYTILAASLIIWSRNKPIKKIYMVVFYSPLLLTILISFEIAIVITLIQIFSVLDGTYPIIDGISGVFPLTLIFSILAAIVITPFGYVFVSIGIIVFKFLVQHKILILEEEEEEMPSILSMIFMSFNKASKDISRT